MEATAEQKKYVVSKGKNPRMGCVRHNGEHPFFYKETVNGFVTACHEVLTNAEYGIANILEKLR